jgi:hypothetical protein
LANFPIEICVTFGGDLKQEIELTLSQFENRRQQERSNFLDGVGIVLLDI